MIVSVCLFVRATDDVFSEDALFFPPSLPPPRQRHCPLSSTQSDTVYRKWQIDRADIHLIHSSGRCGQATELLKLINSTTLLITPLSLHSLLATMITSIDVVATAVPATRMFVKGRERDQSVQQCQSHTVQCDTLHKLPLKGQIMTPMNTLYCHKLCLV